MAEKVKVWFDPERVTILLRVAIPSLLTELRRGSSIRCVVSLYGSGGVFQFDF